MEILLALFGGTAAVAVAYLGYLQVRTRGRIDLDKAKIDTQFDAIRLRLQQCEDDRDSLRKLAASNRAYFITKIAELSNLIMHTEKAKVVGIIETDIHGKITKWSAGAVILFGYTETEVIDHEVTFIIVPEMRHRHLEAFKAWAAEDRLPRVALIHAEAMHRDGQRFPVSVRLVGWKADEWHVSAEIRALSTDELQAASATSGL